jgi:hypothetical protein
VTRGVVETESGEPRGRLQELFQHYDKRNDFKIRSRFLRPRDWQVIPPRIQQLKKRVSMSGERLYESSQKSSRVSIIDPRISLKNPMVGSGAFELHQKTFMSGSPTSR